MFILISVLLNPLMIRKWVEKGQGGGMLGAKAGGMCVGGVKGDVGGCLEGDKRLM